MAMFAIRRVCQGSTSEGIGHMPQGATSLHSSHRNVMKMKVGSRDKSLRAAMMSHARQPRWVVQGSHDEPCLAAVRLRCAEFNVGLDVDTSTAVNDCHATAANLTTVLCFELTMMTDVYWGV